MFGPRNAQAERARLAQLGFAICILALGWLFTLIQRPEASSAGQLTLRVLDVGQGDALLLSTPRGRSVLIDGGPDNQVLRYLYKFLSTGQPLDLVVATHTHADHISGLVPALEEFKANTVWISGAVYTTNTYEQFIRAAGKYSQVKVVHAGETFQLDGVTLTVIYPLTDMTGELPENAHTATIVTRVSYGATSFLLTGDLEDEDEQKIIQQQAMLLPSTVLKVAHHGSENASTDAFLDLVQPRIALISSGRDNTFGHPHTATLERLSERKIQILRTDQSGTITCRSNGIVAHCSQ